MVVPSTQSLTKWHKPPPCFLKLNWDAACKQSSQQLRLGAIIHDENGMVIGSLKCSRVFHPDPFTAEALAFLIAVHFCKEAGLTNIVVEGDAPCVVNLLRKEEEDWSQGGVLVVEAKSFLNSFVYWST